MKRTDDAAREQFFQHLSHALSIASAKKQEFYKAKDAPGYAMWAALHETLTHACRDMHEPQYKRIGKK